MQITILLPAKRSYMTDRVCTFLLENVEKKKPEKRQQKKTAARQAGRKRKGKGWHQGAASETEERMWSD